MFAKGERNGNSKLTEEKVIKIRKMYKDGISQQKIANIIGVAQTSISQIVLYRTWKHV